MLCHFGHITHSRLRWWRRIWWYDDADDYVDGWFVDVHMRVVWVGCMFTFMVRVITAHLLFIDVCMHMHTCNVVYTYLLGSIGVLLTRNASNLWIGNRTQARSAAGCGCCCWSFCWCVTNRAHPKCTNTGHSVGTGFVKNTLYLWCSFYFLSFVIVHQKFRRRKMQSFRQARFKYKNMLSLLVNLVELFYFYLLSRLPPRV